MKKAKFNFRFYTNYIDCMSELKISGDGRSRKWDFTN